MPIKKKKEKRKTGPTVLDRVDVKQLVQNKKKGKKVKGHVKRVKLEDLPKPEYVDSDSDSAPEDVGLKESRDQALTQAKEMMKSFAEAKQKLKEKRRKKTELFTQQKKRKMDEIPAKKTDEEISEDEQNEEEDSEDEDVWKLSDHDSGVEDDNRRSLNFENISGVDFIPLSGGNKSGSSSSACAGVEAVYVKDGLKKAKSSQERAEDFRQQRLYGERMHRESTKKFLSRRAKRMTLRR